jgi:hypothetical protein
MNIKDKLKGNVAPMSAREIMAEGISIFAANPDMLTVKNLCSLRMAASLMWQQEEMGGLEHVQFAYRNNTPIVPPGHCGHPLELVKRGFIDGRGWPEKSDKPKIHLHKWPDGNHWYPSVDGVAVIEDGRSKWNTAQQAEDAAKRFIANSKAEQH